LFEIMQKLLAFPPSPPRSFFEPSSVQTVLYLCYASSLSLGPGLFSYAIQLAELPLSVRVLMFISLTFIAGYGFFMLAGTAHEGFHFTLHRKPVVSASIGMIFSACIPGFIAIGFTLSHWKHHRYTNTDDDPDCEQFCRYSGFWSRLLFARLTANSAYRRVALALVRGRIDEDLASNGLSVKTLQRLCLINIVWHLALMVGLVILCFYAPLLAVCTFIAPLLATMMITGLNPYQEHAATGIDLHTKARTRTSPLFTLLMLGTNYHLEHHLYPRVPCWRLPALHLWLVNTDWYRQGSPIIIKSFSAAFSPCILSGSSHYGTPVNCEASQ
jgi:beta-carotene hydroxylase